MTENFNQSYHLPCYTSINTAELYAIYKGIDYCNSLVQENFVICTDSLSSLQALKNIFNRHPLIQKIHDTLNYTEKNFTLLWTPGHVGIRMNETVDQLAKDSLNETVFETFKFIVNDLKPLISFRVNTAWNNEWQEEIDNELKQVKPTVKKWDGAEFLSRKDSIVLTRLRIGHTRITKSYRFQNNPPICQCGEILNVKHIFETCQSNAHVRRKFGITGIESLSLQTKSNVENIIKFVKEIGLYFEI